MRNIFETVVRVSRDLPPELPLRLCCIAVSMALSGMAGYNRFAEPTTTRQQVDDNAELFRWFDQLGFHDFSSLPFVKVTTGWWSQRENEEPGNHTMYAFLMRESDDGFVVYSLDLAEIEFKFSPPESPAHLVVRYERADLAEFCRARLKKHAGDQTGDPDDPMRFLHSRLNEGSELVILARACAAQNESELSGELLAAAPPVLRIYTEEPEAGSSMQEDFSDDLANMMMWGIIGDFGDLNVSRPELLTRLETFMEKFETSRHFQRAKDSAEILRTMIEEDRAHRTPEDFEQLTVEEKVEELIFQLRDQNGRQLSQPGGCDIFAVDTVTSPAHQLVRIGPAAVPQLTEALEDKRFTRSVGFHRNFYFSHNVLRIGDAARQILDRINNRRFDEPPESRE